ncbi:hypothetical protein ACFQH6_12980 [Halobacteriaceae archaeon GCM10025711]
MTVPGLLPLHGGGMPPLVAALFAVVVFGPAVAVLVAGLADSDAAAGDYLVAGAVSVVLPAGLWGEHVLSTGHLGVPSLSPVLLAAPAAHLYARRSAGRRQLAHLAFVYWPLGLLSVYGVAALFETL